MNLNRGIIRCKDTENKTTKNQLYYSTLNALTLKTTQPLFPLKFMRTKLGRRKQMFLATEKSESYSQVFFFVYIQIMANN